MWQWDANGDGDQFIRQEGDTLVMAEMNGPGCIWRIWSATAEQGHVKIYLDGQEQPAVDLPFQEYFTGKSQPFAYPALSYQLADVGSRGHNLYVPIPYQKSCKVVADKGWGAYYHVRVFDVCAGHAGADIQRGPVRRTTSRRWRRSMRSSPRSLGRIPRGLAPARRRSADTVP